MQNKHNFVFRFGNSNFWGGGMGSTRLGQNPQKNKRKILPAPLMKYLDNTKGNLVLVNFDKNFGLCQTPGWDKIPKKLKTKFMALQVIHCPCPNKD